MFKDWNLFVVLLTIRACRQLGLIPPANAAQPITLGTRINLVRHWTLLVQNDYSLLLECHGKPHLQIVGLYTCSSAQSEKHVEAAFQMFLESQMSRHPVLIVSVDDSSGPAVNWSPPLLEKFKRLRSATLLSDNLSLVEASPLRIDSTELVARIIRWLTAEMDWPRLPIQESLNGWSDVWPEFTKQAGIDAIGQNIQFSLAPSDTLIAVSKKRASETKLLLEQTLASHKILKLKERRAKNDRRALASINIRKKELSTRGNTGGTFVGGFKSDSSTARRTAGPLPGGRMLPMLQIPFGGDSKRKPI